MPDVAGIAGDRLRSLIERIERLEEEKRTLNADIKEVFAEAKGTGFDTKIMRQLIKLRRMDKDDLDEQEALLEIYKRALGMLADTPLGDAAVAEAVAHLRESGVRVTVTGGALNDEIVRRMEGAGIPVERVGEKRRPGRPRRVPAGTQAPAP
jgi:uncharacterized protein (UPF0335 family)